MRADPASAEATWTTPRRVVAIGGGTGLPAVLRGVRLLVAAGQTASLTAIVTVSDDGGSSGRLRDSMGVLPPGDIRNCLVALAEEETLLSALFQHRYGRSDLEGHSVGNLILAALTEQTGSFLKAIEMSSRVLRTVGKILPATQHDVRLKATLRKGSEVCGETRIASVDEEIERISLVPRDATPAPGVVDAILEADLIALGPGSLYTSILPNLAVGGIARALRRTRASIVLVGNLVSERGAAARLGLEDHVSVIEHHAGGAILDGLLVNNVPIDDSIASRYEEEGAAPLYWKRDGHRRIRVEQRNLVASGPKLRHDPHSTANGLVETWAALKSPAGAGAVP